MRQYKTSLYPSASCKVLEFLSVIQPTFLTAAHTCHISVARKVPFDDPHVLQYVRIAYVASQGIALLVYYYASSKVGRNFLFSAPSLTCVR
jgi:hypothetical protein